MLAPGKQLQLIEKAGRKAARLAIYAANAAADPETPPCIEPLAPGSSLQRRGLAWMAVQSDIPVISLGSAVVAQRHDRY
jgi:hypothetical protein